MSIQMVRARLGKTLLSLVSILAPSLASTAQATELPGQTITNEPSKNVGVVLAEDRVSELITTSGQAVVTSQPDALRAELGVEVRVRVLTRAREELSLKIAKLSQALKGLGRENLTLQTSQLDVSPLFAEAIEGKVPKLVGYRARSTLLVTLQDVEPLKIGKEAALVIDTGVNAGANIVEGLSFFLTHPERARAKALELAVVDAEQQAKVMATSTGVRVGLVHDISSVPERSGPILFRDDLALRALPDLEPGNITTTANVVVRYHFTRP
ncbi:MAG TPA: SIMPL domain-containing protein [Polyangium sp.]|nr:SIMPL domain-containing protein [Polyangium sp.]